MKDRFRKLHNQLSLNASDNALWQASVDDNMRRLHEGLVALCAACEELARKLEESQIDRNKTGRI
jgi:hypothetical protein